MKAYLFIGTETNEEQTLLDRVQQFPEVMQADIVFGEWDIVALLEVSSPEALGKFVLEKIRNMPEVSMTNTMIIWGQ